MSDEYDVFNIGTGKFIEPEGEEYDNIYEQFLRDLDIYEAEQTVVNRIMRQHLKIHRWSDDCKD